MRNNLLPLPDEDEEWEEITYSPQPIITTIKHADEATYWEEKGWTVEVAPEEVTKPALPMYPFRAASVRVKVSPPEDLIESYVEPLATYHKTFFDALADTTWVMYPFHTENGNRSPKHRFHMEIFDAIIEQYWEAKWESFTPYEWVGALNGILRYVQDNPFKLYRDERKLEEQEEDLVQFVKESLRIAKAEETYDN